MDALQEARWREEAALIRAREASHDAHHAQIRLQRAELQAKEAELYLAAKYDRLSLHSTTLVASQRPAVNAVAGRRQVTSGGTSAASRVRAHKAKEERARAPPAKRKKKRKPAAELIEEAASRATLDATRAAVRVAEDVAQREAARIERERLARSAAKRAAARVRAANKPPRRKASATAAAGLRADSAEAATMTPALIQPSKSATAATASELASTQASQAQPSAAESRRPLPPSQATAAAPTAAAPSKTVRSIEPDAISSKLAKESEWVVESSEDFELPSSFSTWPGRVEKKVLLPIAITLEGVGEPPSPRSMSQAIQERLSLQHLGGALVPDGRASPSGSYSSIESGLGLDYSDSEYGYE